MHKIESNQYILFIDESGKSKLSDIGDNFLLSAVIIEKNLHFALSSFMISLKEKNHIPSHINIHSYDLFEKEKVDGIKLKIKEVNYFFEHFIHLIRGTQMKCILYEADKKPFIDRIIKKAKSKKVNEKAINTYLKNKGDHDILYEILTSRIILQFGKFLEEKNATGEVIVESRRQDDGAVLGGFICATERSKYYKNKNYQSYSKSAFNRITTLSFQNKKGGSFGLELSDIFAWAKWNSKGLKRKPKSKAKEGRINSRIEEIIKILIDNKVKTPEKVSITSSSAVGGFRVSEFINSLKEYRKN
ncbi:MAG: hypothetical protein WC511_07795 [Candidatus Pacearchaeota archaeon]|jgi:hypothetical protein